MAKKPFSEKELQEVLAKAREQGIRPKDAALKLFETMELPDNVVKRNKARKARVAKRKLALRPPAPAEPKPKATVKARMTKAVKGG